MSCFSTEELFEIVFYPLNFFNWISLISSLLFRYSIFKEQLSLSDIWSHWVLLVEMRRIELLTPCLQSRCSPSWATPPKYMVGTNGLEPSTSRLSGVRSNHLSYAPLWWRLRESNPWPPACKAGALPAELNPRIFFSEVFPEAPSKLNNNF